MLQVINRGHAAGAARQTGMFGDVHRFALQPHTAPIPQAIEILLSATYRHLGSSQKIFETIEVERGPLSRRAVQT